MMKRGSSDKPAIRVEGLIKEYPIYENVGRKLLSLFGLKVKPLKVIRALDEISFEIQKGEVVGVIGPNASGKTTLLKVLAGTVSPTAGSVEIDGKLLPMLSLVGGFNLNLTGLENIYHKATILGTTPSAVEGSLDKIIKFSGLGKEIDQPLRTYSSGMLLRLGFSIMIHIDFEILIVDEVMFVGDLVFTRKSEGAIRELRDAGKTILIASHSLEFISDFADRLMFLDRGKLVLEGSPEDVVSRYIQHCDKQSSSVELGGVVEEVLKKKYAQATETLGSIRIERVEFINNKGEDSLDVVAGEPLSIRIHWAADQPVTNPCFRVQFFRNDGTLLHGSNTHRHSLNAGTLTGTGVAELEYPSFYLLEGEYYVSVGIWPDEYSSYVSRQPYDIREYAYVMKVKSKRPFGGGLAGWPNRWRIINNSEPEYGESEEPEEAES